MTTTQRKTPCYRCRGSKQETYTETETDLTMSVVMGSATGTGYFPMTRVVTKTRTCTSCNGSGEQR